MEWYFTLVMVLGICFPIFFYRKENFSPENVLQEDGEYLVILGYPRMVFSKKTGRRIPKAFVHKIQVADQIITFFNKSDNAVDLMLPSGEIAGAVCKRAQQLFPNAELVEIKVN